MTQALMVRLIAYRFGSEATAQIGEPSVDTADWTSLQTFVELMVNDENSPALIRDAVVELVSSGL